MCFSGSFHVVVMIPYNAAQLQRMRAYYSFYRMQHLKFAFFGVFVYHSLIDVQYPCLVAS